MSDTLTRDIIRRAVEQIIERLGAPQYDAFEDDGEVIWLYKNGKVGGCVNRQQFYEIRGEVMP